MGRKIAYNLDVDLGIEIGDGTMTTGSILLDSLGSNGMRTDLRKQLLLVQIPFLLLGSGCWKVVDACMICRPKVCGRLRMRRRSIRRFFPPWLRFA